MDPFKNGKIISDDINEHGKMVFSFSSRLNIKSKGVTGGR